MVNRGIVGTGGDLDVRGKVWETWQAWPTEVIEGLSIRDGWAFTQWTTDKMQQAQSAGEIDLIVWYCEGKTIGATVTQFQDTVGGLNLEILGAYSVRGGMWAKYVLPSIEAKAMEKGCVSVTMGSPRKINKLGKGYEPIAYEYRKVLQCQQKAKANQAKSKKA